MTIASEKFVAGLRGWAPLSGLAVLSGLAASLSGCLDPLPDPTRIDDLRVLAIRAEPPEVPAGADVVIDALVVDPLGREISLEWYLCLMPARAQGFFGGGGQTQTSGGNGTPLDGDPDGSSCKLKFERGRPWTWSLGNASVVDFTVPESLLADDDALRLAYGLPEGLEIPELVRQGFLGISGINLTIELTATAGDREIVTRKWLNVSTESLLPGNDRNLNPTDLALVLARSPAEAVDPQARVETRVDGGCFAGGTPELEAGVGYRLDPVNAPENPPEYVVLLAGSTTGEPFELQTRTETLFYSFFATAGKLDKETSRTPGEPWNAWLVPAEEKGVVEFWTVVRDGRGGVAWCSEQVTVR